MTICILISICIYIYIYIHVKTTEVLQLYCCYSRAFIECSAKEQTQLRKIVEEAVWISYQSWFQRNLSLPKSSNFVGCNQKVERKWSLAAQLSSSWPMSSWSNSSGTVNSVSSAADTAQKTAMASNSNREPKITGEVNANFLHSSSSSRNFPR